MRPTTTVGVAALALALAACGGEPAPPRHVIAISLDTTRADHFGFAGNERVATPRLDALAAESIVFPDFMTVVSTTLASHTSLFTGKYAHHHGVPRNGFVVNEDNEMLAEILKREGFHTAGFAGSFALESRFDFAQGFDHYDESFDTFAGIVGDQDQRRAETVTDAVIAYLDQIGVPEHLFLFVHYFDPHLPYDAPPPFETRYDPRGREDLPPIGLQRGKKGRLVLGRETPVARRYAAQYAAEISYLDEHVGRLLDALAERGILDQAIVVVTSDHGENFWEHVPFFGHGRTVYRTTMDAVGMIRLPGGERGGTVVRGVLASIDILPTVLRELHIEPPAGVDGEAIPLRGDPGAVQDRTRFGQATYPWRVEREGSWANLPKARFVREGRYKLIQTPYLHTAELYDLEADPHETHNLLASPTPEVQALAARLAGELDAWAASADPLPSRFEPSQTEETLERLRRLGYLIESEGEERVDEP